MSANAPNEPSLLHPSTPLLPPAVASLLLPLPQPLLQSGPKVALRGPEAQHLVEALHQLRIRLRRHTLSYVLPLPVSYWIALPFCLTLPTCLPNPSLNVLACLPCPSARPTWCLLSYSLLTPCPTSSLPYPPAWRQALSLPLAVPVNCSRLYDTRWTVDFASETCFRKASSKPSRTARAHSALVIPWASARGPWAAGYER